MRYAIVNAAPANGRFEFSMWHETEELAVAEAKRLSFKHNGKEFIVLKEVGSARCEQTPIRFSYVEQL